MCLDLRHPGNFLSDSLRMGRAFGVFLVKGIKVLAAAVLSKFSRFGLRAWGSAHGRVILLDIDFLGL
ncbi:hypothetical protein L6452_04146 [Arctium lappa]|uniref:Uncharacterized protein n=1 Tax=Arctium lappa TaxID=4217 RepID=A0ACB9FP77_ARCLA|nr:hypothetical protein L6452_04146 [Arctium lappa]